MASLLARIRRRLRFGRPIIVVSGLPRSGTSMAMRMLEAGGLPTVTDGVRAADDSNPHGYYEHERVLDLDKGGDTTWLAEARGRAVKVVSALLPYLPERYAYKVIFMRRDLREVIASQHTMLAKRGRPDAPREDDGGLAADYEAHLTKIRNLLARRDSFEVLDVDYQEVVRAPLDQACRIAAFLGGSLDVDRMAAAVDPALHRNRRY